MGSSQAMSPEAPPTRPGLRHRVHTIIFEADTRTGRWFDIGLFLLIGFSVVLVCLESVASIRKAHGPLLVSLEWVVTILFTIEYVLRLWCVKRPAAYAKSFFGIVDLLAILPTYIGMAVGGGQSLMVIRALRLLRMFRVLKLVSFVGEATVLREALRRSTRKIVVFLGAVLIAVIIIAALMVLIEGEESGFDNIPESMYWAIVTLTTVGYGDIHPMTPLGKTLASVVMIMGYGILAVPTGIVSVELANQQNLPLSTQACRECGFDRHAEDALFCKRCGAKL